MEGRKEIQTCPLCHGNIHRHGGQTIIYHKESCIAAKHLGWAKEVDVILTATKKMYAALRVVRQFEGMPVTADAGRCIDCGERTSPDLLVGATRPHEKWCRAQYFLQFVKQALLLLDEYERYGVGIYTGESGDNHTDRRGRAGGHPTNP